MRRIALLLACTALTGGWWWDSPSSVPAPKASLAESTLHSPSDWGSPSSGGVTDLTKNYYVVFDGSGSMSERACGDGTNGRIVPARNAMIRFERMLTSDTNLGLYVFDAHGWSERVVLSRGELNRKAYEAAIASTDAGNGTPLGASLVLAYDALRKQSLKQNGYGEYHIVVVTDGGATDASLMDKVVAKITTTPVVLETIGFCIAEGHTLNQPGKTIYHNAMNPSELNTGLAAILAETEDFSGKGTFR